MRLTFLTVFVIVLCNGFPAAAHAWDYPWCVGTREGRTDCGFFTRTSNVWRPRPASVSCIEINAHCGVTGRPRHRRRRAVLGERVIEAPGSVRSASVVVTVPWLSVAEPAADLAAQA